MLSGHPHTHHPFQSSTVLTPVIFVVSLTPSCPKAIVSSYHLCTTPNNQLRALSKRLMLTDPQKCPSNGGSHPPDTLSPAGKHSHFSLIPTPIDAHQKPQSASDILTERARLTCLMPNTSCLPVQSYPSHSHLMTSVLGPIPLSHSAKCLPPPDTLSSASKYLRFSIFNAPSNAPQKPQSAASVVPQPGPFYSHKHEVHIVQHDSTCAHSIAGHRGLGPVQPARGFNPFHASPDASHPWIPYPQPVSTCSFQPSMLLPMHLRNPNRQRLLCRNLAPSMVTSTKYISRSAIALVHILLQVTEALGLFNQPRDSSPFHASHDASHPRIPYPQPVSTCGFLSPTLLPMHIRNPNRQRLFRRNLTPSTGPLRIHTKLASPLQRPMQWEFIPLTT